MLDRIGKYKISGEIGKGGFGRVYRAYDPVVGREVAIKLMNASDDPNQLNRFKAEAMMAGKLRHPSIVTIYEFGEENGAPFLAMEFLDGTDFDRILKEKIPLGVLEKIESLLQLAAGLHYAHEQGIVHRDIKPSNVMRLRDGSLKIMDFGIARALQSEASRLTQTGYMVGTTQYMAPEQISHGSADALCDIWAYGVFCYEILAGHNPFLAANNAATMYRIINVDPPALDSFLPGCSAELSRIVAALLEKNRDHRYQSLEDAALDLRSVIRELGSEQTSELVQQAARAMAAGDFESAHTLIRRILDLDPSNARARHWRETLRDQTKRKTVQPRVESLMLEAEQLAADRQYDSAIQKLESALQLDTNNHTIKNRLDRMYEAGEQIRKASLLTAEARRKLDASEIEAAAECIERAATADPLNPGIAELRLQIEAALAARHAESAQREGLAQADQLSARGDHDASVALLERLMRAAPGSAEVAERLIRARELHQAQALQERIRKGMGEASRQLRLGNTEEALAILQPLMRDAPHDSHLASLFRFANIQAEFRKGQDRLEQLAQEARAAVRANDFPRALNLIDEGLSLQADNQLLLQLRTAVLQAVAQAEREARLRAALAECTSLLERDRLDEALQAVTEIEREFNSPDAVELKARIVAAQDREQQIEREAEQKKVEQRARDRQAAINSADSLVRQRRFAAATARLAPFIAQNTNDAEIRQILATIAELERRQRDQERVRTLLEASGELIQRLQWDEAAALVQEALQECPGDPDLTAELRRIESAQRAEQDLAAITNELVTRGLAAALTLAEEAARRNPSHVRLASTLQELRARSERSNIGELANRRLIEGAYQEASRIVAEGLERFPASAELQALRDRVEEGRRRAEELDRAWAALEAGRFDAVELFLASNQNHPQAQALRDELAARQEKEARQRRYQDARRRADTCSRRRDFEGAIQELQLLRTEFPEAPGLTEEIRAFELARHEQSRNQQMASARARLEGLLGAQQFDEAEAVLHELLAQFPNDPGLLADADSIREARALRGRREYLEHQVDELEQLFRAGDTDQVRRRAEALLRESNEPRARELLQWAEESRKKTRELRTRRVAGKFARFYWAAAGVLVIAGVIVAVRPWAPAASTSPKVDPSTLRFAFRAGDASSAQSIRVQVKPETGWTASAASWISVSPVQGQGEQVVQVTVDQNLAPGDHEGIVTIAAAGSERAVSVRVQVSPKPPPPVVISENKIPAQQPPREIPAAKTNKTTEPPKPVEQAAAVKPPDPLPQQKAEPQTPPVASPKPAGPVIPPQPAPMNPADWKGDLRGSVKWSGGVLKPGEELVLVHGATLSGNGKVTGEDFPPFRMASLEVADPKGMVEIVERPSEANRFGQIKVRNRSSAPVTSIRLSWSIE